MTFSVPDLLDRAKRGAGIESDYALAKLMGTHKANVSVWRNEKSAPDERAILKLCELSGDDPVDVAIEIQSSRAANDEAMDLWGRVSARLKSAGQNVLVYGSIAIVFAAVHQDATAEIALPPLDEVAGLYIMSNALRWTLQWLWRSGRRSWAMHQMRKALSCNPSVTA